MIVEMHGTYLHLLQTCDKNVKLLYKVRLTTAQLIHLKWASQETIVSAANHSPVSAKQVKCPMYIQSRQVYSN